MQPVVIARAGKAALEAFVKELQTGSAKIRGATRWGHKPFKESPLLETLRRQMEAIEREQEQLMARSKVLAQEHRKLFEEMERERGLIPIE